MVTDSAGQPLPISKLTGVTLPKIGKMHWRKSRQERSAVLEKAEEKTLAGTTKLAGRSARMLRDQAARRGQVLPPGIQLFRVEIQYNDGKLKETKELLFAE